MTSLTSQSTVEQETSFRPKTYYRYLPFFQVNQRLMHYLLLGYFLLVPTGNLLRFINDERQGVATLLLGTLLLLNLALSLVVLPREPVYILVTAFTLWSLTLTVYGAVLESSSFYSPLIFMAYVLLSTSLAYFSYFSPGETIRKYYFAAACAGALFSVATLLDYYGVINVGLAAVEMSTIGANQVLTAELEGQFSDRSTYGGIIAILAPGWFVLMMESKTRWHSLLYALATAGTFLLLLYTHHRMIVLVMVGIVLSYTLGNVARNKRRWLLMLLVMAGVAWFVARDSNIVTAMQIKFGEAFSTASSQGQSDLVRVELLRISVENLLRNPIGNGWTKLPLSPVQDKGAHSAYTQIIWAGGLVGVITLVLLALAVLKTYLPLYRQTTAEQKSVVRPLVYSLLGWAIFAMGHQALSIGVGWILLGLLVGQLRKFSSLRAVSRT